MRVDRFRFRDIYGVVIFVFLNFFIDTKKPGDDTCRFWWDISFCTCNFLKFEIVCLSNIVLY